MKVLSWDSAFFGLRIAQLASAQEDELALARAASIQCAYVRVATDDIAGIRTVERSGGRLVDTRMVFECDLGRLPEMDPESFPVRPHHPKDTDRLLAIAASAHTDSRFYADDRLPQEKVGRLYPTWLQESISGNLAKHVFVAELNSNPIGYVTMAGDGQIGLIGVHPGARSVGAGTAMIRYVQRTAKEANLSRIKVVTQAANVRAMRLYERCGYQVHEAMHTFHIWF